MKVNDPTIQIKMLKNEGLPKLDIKNCRQKNKNLKDTKHKASQKCLTLKKDKRNQLRNSQKVLEILTNININCKSKANLETRQNILFDTVFIRPVKSQTLQKIQNKETKINENLFKYDEGAQKIKEVTKKNKNYLIYDLIAKKNQKKNNLIKAPTQDRQQLEQVQIQSYRENLKISQSEYFNEQISFEIPNLLSCEKNQTDILGISDNTITKKILDNFSKNKHIPNLNTNFLTHQRHHEKQLIFYQALLSENKQKYSQAIQYYKKFLQYVTRFNRELLIGYCHNKLGVNYYNLKKYEKSINHHKQCIKYQSEEKFSIKIIRTFRISRRNVRNLFQFRFLLKSYLKRIQNQKQYRKYSLEYVKVYKVSMKIHQIFLQFFKKKSQNMIKKHYLEALNLPLMFYKTQIAKIVKNDEQDYQNSYNNILDYVITNGNEKELNLCKVQIGLTQGEINYQKFKDIYLNQQLICQSY